MRKCGRSIISPEQDRYKHYCNDLHEFNEEITLAIEHIIKEAKSANRKILLFGHSTGKKNSSKKKQLHILLLNRRSYCFSLCMFWHKIC